MNYKTRANTNEEQLPWESHIPFNATKLIIGTFPTQIAHRKFEFFYPNTNNHFWKTLSDISGIGLLSHDHPEAVINRKQILDKLKLGITDMGHRVLRHGMSSSDGAIFPVEYTDIFKMLDQHLTIRKLILTSSSGGNSVESWFRSYCNMNGVLFPKLKGTNPKHSSINHSGKSYEVVSVHSTSKAAARPLEELINMYKAEIL